MTQGTLDDCVDNCIAAIRPVDTRIATATQALLDRKTKPPGSLGMLELVACRVAGATGRPAPPRLDKAIVLMGADHGVARHGVSAYPQEVTGQMMVNFSRGGAAINVLARRADARVVVVDMGVANSPGPLAGVRSRPVAAGTRNFLEHPAMVPDQALAAIRTGIETATELAEQWTGLIGIGEMGIGNTTSASAIAAALMRRRPADLTGRGTGIDDPTLKRKVAAIESALAMHQPDPDDALDVIAKVGGFEIAGLCGVVLGSAAQRIPVMVDGFIATVAALLAVRFAPHALDYLIASHVSVEPGHALVLQELGLQPLLDLNLRLGEGTGAALAMPLVDSALAILHEMATFEDAGVSEGAERG